MRRREPEQREFSARFDGTRLRAAASPKGKAGIDAADIEPWLMTAGVGLPGMGTGMPVELDAETDSRTA